MARAQCSVCGERVELTGTMDATKAMAKLIADFPDCDHRVSVSGMTPAEYSDDQATWNTVAAPKPKRGRPKKGLGASEGVHD